jgi:hypothetical protein
LSRAAGEGRLLVWSADPAEQAVLAGTVLAGPLPERDSTRATVGIFINDAVGTKLDYYLTRTAALAVTGCTPDGRRVLHLTLTLGSTAPSRGLPEAVLGLGYASGSYIIKTQVLVFSPTLGSLEGAAVDGQPVTFAQGLERHRFVGVFYLNVEPGGTTTLTVDLLTAPQPPASAGLTISPGVNPPHLTGDVELVCPLSR